MKKIKQVDYRLETRLIEVYIYMRIAYLHKSVQMGQEEFIVLENRTGIKMVDMTERWMEIYIDTIGLNSD